MTPLVAIRALNLVCGAVALGVPAVLAIVVLPAFSGRAWGGEHQQALLKSLLRLTWTAIIVGVLSGLLWLLLQTAMMSGRTVHDSLTSAIIGTVLWRTRFGNVLFLRLVLALLEGGILAILHAARGVRTQRAVLGVAAFAAAGGLSALAWAGHAAETPGVVHLAADAAHLLAAGIWLGGLIVLAVFFGMTMRFADPVRVDAADQATQRFSLLGIACVGTLLVTGLVNSWFLVGSIPALVGTDYGYLLLVKLALFTIMVGLAAVNRFRLTPRLRPVWLHVGSRRIVEDAVRALRLLRRNSIAEALLGGLVVVIVSALGAVPPGLHAQPWWPFAWRYSTEALAQPSVYKEVVVASAMIAAGVALCVISIAWRRYRLPAFVIALVLIAWFTPSLGLLTVAAYPTTFYRSPVPYTTASIARGANLFADNCTQCHGARGKGDGPAAKTLNVRPADLTAAHVLMHSEGEVFWWLGAGIAEAGMPGYAGRLGEDERWDLVNWVRTLPVGGLEEGLATEVGTGPAPRAPDFSYVDADGKESSLQTLLERGPILLVLFTPSSDGVRLQRLAAADKELTDAGLGLLALPLSESSTTPPGGPRFVGAADASVALAYRVIAAVPRYDLAMSATHLELLIDPQGYVRALWLPQETVAWDDVRSLAPLVGQLAKRQLAPYSAAHAH